MVDAQLKTLADCGIALDGADAELAEGAHANARERLDEAVAALATVREQWPELTAAQRAVIGPPAIALRKRLDATAPRVRPLTAVSEAAPEVDPEQEREPEAA